jgi:hypothetical protein
MAEDTFVFTNPVTQSRKDDLRNAMIAICCRAPNNMAAENLPVSAEIYALCGIQPGNDGWLARIFQALSENIQGYTVRSDFRLKFLFFSLATPRKKRTKRWPSLASMRSPPTWNGSLHSMAFISS